MDVQINERTCKETTDWATDYEKQKGGEGGERKRESMHMRRSGERESMHMRKSVCGGGGGGETDRQTDRQTETERDTERENGYYT